MKNIFRPYLAELLGTFIFVFIGAGSLIADNMSHGAVGLLGIALAHGLALAIVISALGSMSSGYCNPAVSLGLFIAGKINRNTLIGYVIAQLLGGALAGLVLRAVFSTGVWRTVHLGTPALSANVTVGSGLLLETVLTFFLMIAVLGTAVDSMAPKIGGFGIGLTVTMDILVGGPLTGAAMNPARVFGPALAAGYWDSHWIYWVGPALGASLASWIYTRWISDTI